MRQKLSAVELETYSRQIVLNDIGYEGQLKPEDKKEIVQLIKEKYPNIVIITSSMLQRALIDNSTKNTIKELTAGIDKEVTL